MLNRLTYEERERLAHAEGFVNTAELFAKIADLEHAARTLINAFELYGGNDLGDEINAAVGTLREELP
jgi:hypothetical protein